MFDIKVDDRIIDHCKDQIRKYNFGQRGIADGTQEQQLTGIIGQSAVMDIFGLGLVDGKTGFDKGIDINYNDKKIDVKTMGRTTSVKPGYVNNFLGLQKKYDTDIYIFCSYNKKSKILTVCGWVTKDEFLEKAEYYPKGTIRKRTDGTEFKTFADLYEIDNSDLNIVNSIEELKKGTSNAKKIII